MDKVTLFAQYPNGTKLYNVRGQMFEIDKNYTLNKLIGSGAYGVVCSAVASSEAGNAHVAIKKIPRVFNDVREAKCVLREMSILTSMHHPNIIRLRHFICPHSRETFEDVYLIMDLCDIDLNRIIKSRQKLTEEHYQYFMIQAFRGLHYLHSANIMHRDLKPSNLLVNADCALAICDFGLARDERMSSSTNLTQYVVTRWYRPPEILGMGLNQYTSAVDVWSLGLIFAELIVGKTILPGKDYIAQLLMIVNLLGTPSEEDMEFLSTEARNFVHSQPWVAARSFTELFPTASKEAADLLSKLLVFHPAKRLTAREVMMHPYFAQFRDPALEQPAEKPFVWLHGEEYNTVAQLRDAFWQLMSTHCSFTTSINTDNKNVINSSSSSTSSNIDNKSNSKSSVIESLHTNNDNSNVPKQTKGDKTNSNNIINSCSNDNISSDNNSGNCNDTRVESNQTLAL